MDFSGFILFLKILSALISIGFVIGSIYSWLGIQKVNEMNASKRRDHFSRGAQAAPQKTPQQKQWDHIVGLFQSADPHAWRMAIIDADTMLEDMITQMGFIGGHFGEKLKSMQEARVPWVQSAWDVHLLRNKLAHEGSRYPLNNREAYQAFKTYEALLHNNGYLA